MELGHKNDNDVLETCFRKEYQSRDNSFNIYNCKWFSH